MSWYRDRYEGHPYFELSNRIAHQMRMVAEDASVGRRDAAREASDVISYVRARFDEANPAFFSNDQPQRMFDQLVPIGEALDQFQSSRDDGALTRALLDMSNFVEASRAVLDAPIDEARSTKALMEAAAELDAARMSLRSDLEKLPPQVAELRTDSVALAERTRIEIASLVEQARTAVDEARGTALTAFEQRATEFREKATDAELRIAHQIERLDAAITDQGQKFLDEQQARRAAFGEAQGEIEAVAHADLDSVKERSEPLIQYLQERADTARSIVAATAAESTAKQYLEAEMREAGSADRWRYIGLGLLAVSVVVAIITAFELAPSADDGWDALLRFYLIKSPIGGLVLYAIVYCLTQSGDHRRRSIDAGRIARELSVFRPFIDELPPETKYGVIKDATKDYFRGQSGGSPADGDMPVPPRP